MKKVLRKNSVKFLLERMVPAVRTTQSMKYTSRQYKRYAIFKTYCALQFLMAAYNLNLKFMEAHEPTLVIYLKGLKTQYRDLLMKTIGKSKKGCFAEVEVGELREKVERSKK